MNKIAYKDYIFQDNDIKSGNLFLATSLLSSQLQVNSFESVVKCDDPSILDFERNTPLYYYSKPEQPMIFRVQSIDRIGPNLYEISATSTLGLLTDGQHMGGIYTGQTTQEVIASICGAVPFYVKSNLETIKLYGWLPIAAPRDNLSQVLFAIGAALKTDLDGVLRIEGLWDGISGAVTRDNLYTDATVDYDGKITQVIVNEHQYIPWTEEKQLFEGTAQKEDIITFNEPMHTLTADGFSILDSGANWAKVSAGSGTLTGKTYIHNTRQISKDVWPAREPNIKTVKDATLVSLVNSQACAQRLADYYRCRERVDASVVYQEEKPGDRLSTYHPFDKVGVAACLESADITLSNTLKAKEKSLVGFVPPQIEQWDTYDHQEVLTGSGTWMPPEGTTTVLAVLIGAGQGGKAGKAGEKGTTRSYSYSTTVLEELIENAHGYAPGVGGAGGEGGEPGEGGKIYQLTVDITGVLSVEYQCGIGGLGADFNASFPDTPGQNGTATIFHGVSSELGSSSAAGYLDIITGEIYAKKGLQGLSGGNGGGYDGQISEDTEFSVTPGENITDENGNVWNPGSTSMAGDKIDRSGESIGFTSSVSRGRAGAGASSGIGSGAAAGANGSTISNGTYTVSKSSDGTVITAKSKQSDGANGATPKLIPSKPGYGQGGRGGYGGGGGASAGWADYYTLRDPNVALAGTFNTSVTSGTPGNGGDGGTGGPGGDGIILLYYSIKKIIPHGQFVDKNGRMFLDRFFRRFIV